jgi:RNA polymerase sigma factor (sigma-70 family)
MSVVATEVEPRAVEATRLLFETHRQRILGYCVGQLGNRQDAEDAVQTTFLYAFGCLERGVVPEVELAWLFKIAHNVCRTRRRSLGRRRRIEAPVDFDACEYALAAPERSDDELLGLPGALAAMPATQRKALLLREWQGLSYAEIAGRLELSQSAVETLLFRARRTLASHLTRIPRQVAVFANAPLLLRMLRRLVPTTGALKTTAAVVAIGAVSTVGGRELERSAGKHAAKPARAAQHMQIAVRIAPIPHRLTALAPAVVQRASRPQRVEAPSSAEAAPQVPAGLRALPPAASAPTPATQDAVAATSAAAPAAPVAPAAVAAAAAVAAPAMAAPLPVNAPLPTIAALPVAPAAAAVGEVAGSAVTTATSVVQIVTALVPPLPVDVTDAKKLLPPP